MTFSYILVNSYLVLLEPLLQAQQASFLQSLLIMEVLQPPSLSGKPSVENWFYVTKVWLELDGSNPDTLFRCALMSAELRWMTPSLYLWVERLLIQPWAAVTFPCSVHCLPPWLGHFCRLMSQTGSQIPACTTAGGPSFPAARLGICLVEFCQVPVVLFLQPAWITLNSNLPSAMSKLFPQI